MNRDRTARKCGRWISALRIVLPLLILISPSAKAAAPYFTGLGILTPIAGSTVNLRSQGALAGSAPMRVESVSILPLGLGVSADVVNGVCVQVTNTLGIDLLSAGVLLSVLVSNPEAPRGVRGTILLLPGLSNNNDLNSCADPSTAPIANAGGNRTVADTDQAPGEVVTLDGTRSFDPDGTIATYTWTDADTNQPLGTGPTIQPRLSDGSHQIRLTVTDNSGGPQGTGSTTVNITVQAPVPAGNNGGAPTPNPGTDRSLLDTDGLLGELVTLDASASIASGTEILSFEWLDSQQNLLGVGVTLSVRLPDGINDITLRVTGSNLLSSTASVTIAVGAPLIGQLLESLPDLTPDQRSVAGAIDDLCARLQTLAETQPLPAAQVDLLNRCSGIIGGTNPIDQLDALEELGASDLVAIRTQALVFSSNQYSGVMNRLATARLGGSGSGVTSFNFGGASINIDGKPVPIQNLQMVVKQFWEMFGQDEEGSSGGGGDNNPLFSDRLGLWLRSNYDRGDKTVSPVSDGFEGDQWGLTGGADYRFGERSILGFALGYGKSDLEFRPTGRGSLATTSWTASLYGSAYPWGDLYVDAVFNYGDGSYDTTRRISYSEGGTQVDRTASGNTGGRTLSGGISLGYDWSIGGFTLSPTAGYFHSRAKIDPFAENGANGLDLAYGEQSYKSSAANLSFAINYAWSTPWMVLLPHVRGEYLHELNNDVEVFGIRFANDPFSNTSNPTPPVIVRSDVPDQWYWRLAAGISAQFKYGFSGYVEYQRLEDFQFVNFENLTLGLRFQRSL